MKVVASANAVLLLAALGGYVGSSDHANAFLVLAIGCVVFSLGYITGDAL